MEVVEIKTVGAQGDLLIKAVKAIPNNLKPVNAEAGQFIAAHSETGHHHVLSAGRNKMWQDLENPFICYLQVNEAFADFVHCRDFDTHKTRRVEGGGKYYQLINQREGNQNLWRRTAD